MNQFPHYKKFTLMEETGSTTSSNTKMVKSKCHNAEARLTNFSVFNNYYLCSHCQQPCELMEQRAIEEVKKPPLGLTPFHIHQEMRLSDIYSAIERYSRGGINIPNEWIAEKRTLEAYMHGIHKEKTDGKELSAEDWFIAKSRLIMDFSDTKEKVLSESDFVEYTHKLKQDYIQHITSQKDAELESYRSLLDDAVKEVQDKDAQIQALSKVIESQKQTADALVNHIEEATKDNVELIKKMREVYDNAKLTLDTLNSYKQVGDKMTGVLKTCPNGVIKSTDIVNAILEWEKLNK